MDLTKALAPKSDQLDFADLDGSAPQVFTITDVSENGSELADQQPVNIKLAEFPRVWRPSKGMLRVLADNWGKDVKVWIGRQVELYGDPNVYFGKEKRGGTRISRLSHISAKKTTLVNPRGGRGAYWSVDPLPKSAPAPAPEPTDQIPKMLAAYERAGVTRAMLEAHQARAVDEWDEQNVANLTALFEDLRAKKTTKADEFPEVAS
jgi:hypothetical protein